jgi:oxygen-independent coproporphyrinogen-3 oxidase
VLARCFLSGADGGIGVDVSAPFAFDGFDNHQTQRFRAFPPHVDLTGIKQGGGGRPYKRLMNPLLSAYAQQSAPRYTSYPPATHFTAAADRTRFRTWLATMAPESAFSLYIHVPYCHEICWYCGCNTFATRREEPLDDFVETVRRELDLVASATRAHTLASVHWGGGTPNILAPDRFARIARHVEFWFDLGEVREHSIELDPRRLTREQAETYSAFGVTRASLGVQDLNEHVQRAMGRLQPHAQVAEAARLLRSSGIKGLSMDLMYGLPKQTVEDVRRTVRLAIEMGPQRVAVFGYAHVPWFKKRQRLIDAAALPGASERFDQAAAARDELLIAGYEAVGLDHFAEPSDELALAARSGRAKRSFQGYALGYSDATIGVGPSAISTLPQGYAQNAVDVAAWRRAIEAGRLATTRGHELSRDDERRGAIIEHLMCGFGVDLTAYGGEGAFAPEMMALHDLQQGGLVRIDGPKLFIPEAARPFTRIVANVFDAYRQDGSVRYSRVI